MSIRIGNGLTNYTNSERILLSTGTQSNIFVVKPIGVDAARLDLNMVFDPDNTNTIFGKYGSGFKMTTSGSNIAAFSVSSCVFQGDVSVGNSLNIGSNLSSSGTTTSNITIYTDRSINTPYLVALTSNGPLLSADTNGIMSVYGQLNVGSSNFISTTTGITGLNVENVNVKNSASIPNLYTSNITTIGRLNLDGDVNITGRLTYGVLTYDTLSVTSWVQSSRSILSNVVRLTEPQYRQKYSRFSQSDANAVEITVGSNTSTTCNVALMIDRYGRTIVGATTADDAMLTLKYARTFNATNVLSIQAEGGSLSVGSTGNVGLGTTSANQRIAIYQNDTSVSQSALLGLYTDYNASVSPNFLECYSNNPTTPVLFVSGDGTINTHKALIGISNVSPSDAQYNIITSFLKSSNISTDFITSTPDNIYSNISFSHSKLIDIDTINTSNLNVSSNLEVYNLHTINFKTDNIAIPGLNLKTNIVNDIQQFQNVTFMYSNIFFSRTPSDYASSNTNKMLLRSDDIVATGTTSSAIGINVVGNNYNSIRVTSALKPALELFGSTYSTYMTHDTTSGAFYISHSRPEAHQTETNDVQNHARLKIYPYISTLSDGGLHLNNTIAIYKNMLGINVTNYNDATFTNNTSYKLQVYGDILCQNEEKGHTVLSTKFYSLTAPLKSGVGIGTPSPSEALDVIGNVKVSGSGYFGCNVGIGTVTPKYTLDVNGTGHFSNVVIDQMMFSFNAGISNLNTSNIVSSNIKVINPINANILGSATWVTSNVQPCITTMPFSCNIGTYASTINIGSYTPSSFSSNTSANTIYLNSSNVRAIDNIVNFTNLTVTNQITGDVKFTAGTVRDGVQPNITTIAKTYEIGTTTTNTITLGNSNVLVNINSYKATFSSNITVTSNLTVNGRITAGGNISSTSDMRIKKDLVQISNPMEKISQLTGYTYTRINEVTQKRECGLMAQDVLKVLPEVVETNTIDSMYTIAYGNIAGLFVEAFKEMQTRIVDLEQKVADLSQKNKI